MGSREREGPPSHGVAVKYGVSSRVMLAVDRLGADATYPTAQAHPASPAHGPFGHPGVVIGSGDHGPETRDEPVKKKVTDGHMGDPKKDERQPEGSVYSKQGLTRDDGLDEAPGRGSQLPLPTGPARR